MFQISHMVEKPLELIRFLCQGADVIQAKKSAYKSDYPE